MRTTLKVLGLGACLLVWAGLFPAEAAAQAPVRSDSPWSVDVASEAWSGAVPATTLWARDEPAPPLVARDKETGLTLMIVGGAMFVGGLVIGDDGGTLLAVAGVGVGAYGLYLYMD